MLIIAAKPSKNDIDEEIGTFCLFLLSLQHFIPLFHLFCKLIGKYGHCQGKYTIYIYSIVAVLYVIMYFVKSFSL